MSNLQASSHENQNSVRLDIWLWRARFFKTRALASGLIRKGRLRIWRNGQALRIKKPHFALMPTDQIVFIKKTHLYHIEVLDLGHRRGPASEAATLYRTLKADISIRA